MEYQQSPVWESLNSANPNELKQLTEKYPWFQLGWLFYLRILKETGASEYDNVLKRVAVIVPNPKVVADFINDKNNEESIFWEAESATSLYFTDDTENAKQSDSLIDRFLQKQSGSFRKNQDQISEKAGDFVSLEEQSLAESDEIITETLAKIYFDQKKYEKALNAFEKLSLKYPEKSIYFASQIEKIEKLKDNNS